MAKDELFWNEIESLCHVYAGMSPWDAYNLPVSVRKFFIKTYIKRRDNEEEANDTSTKPLTPSEKKRYMQKSQPNSSKKT